MIAFHSRTRADQSTAVQLLKTDTIGRYPYIAAIMTVTRMDWDVVLRYAQVYNVLACMNSPIILVGVSGGQKAAAMSTERVRRVSWNLRCCAQRNVRDRAIAGWSLPLDCERPSKGGKSHLLGARHSLRPSDSRR